MKKFLSVILIVALMVLILPFGLFDITAAAYYEGFYVFDFIYGGVNNTTVELVAANTSVSGDIDTPFQLGGYNVVRIGNNAFSGCSKLTSVRIGARVTDIGDYAFKNCSKLTKVTFGGYVGGIGNCIFEGCTNLSSISVIGNKTYHSANNCVIRTRNNELILGCKDSVIPDGVTKLRKYAFYDCVGLTSINIPKSVTSIADSAFSGCSNLTDIYYDGTEKNRKLIDIGNDNEYLLNATWHYKDCNGNHTWNTGEITKQATCNENGIRTYTCNDCSEMKEEIIEKNNNHTFTSWNVTKSPSCTAKGTEIRTCSTCKQEETRDVPETGHTYTSDCDVTCDNCGWVKENIGEHTFSNNYDTTCNYCGFVRDLPSCIFGDIDADGSVNTGDLASLKLYLAGIYTPTDLGLSNADINSDGVIGTGDLADMKLYLAGVKALN